MARKIIITIDGWSSCGKSTLAKQLAKKLDYIYVDSGAMYRAITLYFLRNKIDCKVLDEVVDALKKINLKFVNDTDNHHTAIHLNGENVEQYIREIAVADKVSEVAANKEVREFAVLQQQEMGKKKGIVMDGRDIGTVVFPKAELKIFMTADNAVRVQRRFKEMVEKNPETNLEEVKKNIEMRDFVDSNRAISPLRKAADARILDNSNLSQKQQLALVMEWADELITKK